MVDAISARSARRLFRHGTVLVAIMVVALALLTSAAAALVNDRDYGCGSRVMVNFRFAGEGWTPERMEQFRVGARDLEVIRTVDGRQHYAHGDLGDLNLPSNIPVNIVFNGGRSFVTCRNNEVQSINMSAMLPTNDATASLRSSFAAVAAHELGHAHGLDHVGQYDGLDGSTPTMTGCRISSDIRFLGEVSRDDDAHALNNTGNTPGTASANRSFETGSFRHWRTAGAAITRGAPDRNWGDYFATVQRGGNLTQQVRVTSPGPAVASAFLSYADSAPLTIGTVALSSRRVEFPAQGADECVAERGYDYSERPTFPDGTGFVLRTLEICGPDPARRGPRFRCQTTPYLPVGEVEDFALGFGVASSLTLPQGALRVDDLVIEMDPPLR